MRLAVQKSQSEEHSFTNCHKAQQKWSNTDLPGFGVGWGNSIDVWHANTIETSLSNIATH